MNSNKDLGFGDHCRRTQITGKISMNKLTSPNVAIEILKFIQKKRISGHSAA